MNATKAERDACKHGNVKIIKEVLEREHKSVLASLKQTKDDPRYYQGSINILDDIISLFGTAE